MISDSLARRYSVALFNLAVGRDELENVTEQFTAFDDIINAQSKFRYFLFSPKVNSAEKKRVITEIFGDSISKSMLHFVFLLLDKKRQTLLPKIYSHFKTLYNNHHNRATITVRPAVPLEDGLLDEVKASFEKLLNKSITVNQEVDSELVGGLQVRVGNTVYDASIASRLHTLRKQLV